MEHLNDRGLFFFGKVKVLLPSFSMFAFVLCFLVVGAQRESFEPPAHFLSQMVWRGRDSVCRSFDRVRDFALTYNLRAVFLKVQHVSVRAVVHWSVISSGEMYQLGSNRDGVIRNQCR